MSHLLPGALEDDEHLPRLFVPQVVLPSQWARRSRAGLGERRLMVAVLLDAVAVYTKCKARGVVNRRFREVDHWFSSDDREWPFAFERICEVLSLNATLIRGAIDGQVGSRLMVRAEKPAPAPEPEPERAPLADALADTL
jgi:hypothetical protein